MKKGEVYEKKLFTAKDECFKCNSFLDEVKHSYTDLINIYVYLCAGRETETTGI